MEVILDTPPDARDDNVSSGEDSPLRIDVLADHGNGSDADAEDNVLPALTVNLTSPAAGVLTNHADGTFTFDPRAHFERLAVGASVYAGLQLPYRGCVSARATRPP